MINPNIGLTKIEAFGIEKYFIKLFVDRTSLEMPDFSISRRSSG
jgi:hypothetical protein